MGKVKDEIGNRYGRLIVLKEVGRNKWGSVLWFCKCECGATTIVSGEHLRTGATKSCGCLQKEIASSFAKKMKPGALPKGIAAFNWLLRRMKKDAKDRNLEWNLPDNKAKELMASSCFYCGAPPKSHKKLSTIKKLNGDFIANGIDRLDNNKGYTEDNVVPCCTCCNIAKSTMSINEFKNHISKIYKHFCKKSINQLNFEISKIFKNEEKLIDKLSIPNYIISKRKDNAKRKNHEWDLTNEETKYLMSLPCFYCNKSPDAHKIFNRDCKGTYYYNGIDRINNKIGYIKNNVVPCCFKCNLAKLTMSIDEFQNHIEKIYKHFIYN